MKNKSSLIKSGRFGKRVGFGLLGVASCLMVAVAWAEESDSMIADNLYSKPLTHREVPIGYREFPIGHTFEPRGFLDNPRNHGINEEVRNVKGDPYNHMLLDTVRNFKPDPPTFTEREAITVANLDQELKKSREEHPLNTANPDLKIERPGTEKTQIKENIKPRNPGYRGINPPSKAKLPDFQ